jgi:riboflavin biosynthesis pyrimidine reductase
MTLTQYYTATSLDGFIADPDNSLDCLFTRADVAAVYEEMLEVAGDRNIWIVGGGDLAGQFADAGLLDEVLVTVAPVTLGGGAPLLPRRVELRLDDLAPNGDFVCATFSVVRPSA